VDARNLRRRRHGRKDRRHDGGIATGFVAGEAEKTDQGKKGEREGRFGFCGEMTRGEAEFRSRTVVFSSDLEGFESGDGTGEDGCCGGRADVEGRRRGARRGGRL
jgi:hypothetical protein